MNNKNIIEQVKITLFYLNNATRENGLKKDEFWKLGMIDEAGKVAIERNYNPTVITKVSKAAVQEFSDNLLFELKTSYPNISVPDQVIEIVKDAEYFVAYSPQRIIR